MEEISMHCTRSLTFFFLALVVLAALGGQAFAGTYYVALDPAHATGCAPGFYFTSINSAINDPAVPAGSTIKVCPGTYQEQVSINKKITLEGIATVSEDAVVILPPAGGLVQNTTDVCPTAYSAFCTNGASIAAQVLVQNIVGSVSISNLTVDGKGNGLSCGPDVRGILFQNASGTLNHVAVRNELPNDIPNGCQVGHGIYVATGTGFFSTVTVENSSIHNYNKNGIVGRYPGTTLTVTGNYVRGAGVVPSGGAAQNGIEIAFDATGTVKTNNVIDNIYGDPTVATSADILLYDAAENSGITISSNTLGNSQVPISIVTDTANLGDGVTVSSNKISGISLGLYVAGETADGIDVCTNGNTITGNTIFSSDESGVHLDASCVGGTGNNNSVTGNTMLESECAGILADSGTSGNTTSPDTYYTVPFPVASSTASCSFVTGEAIVAKAKASLKVSP
jgi:parallel beta-helix repeat protein